jgi:uncharacterized DUF497 family protein
VYNAFVRIDTVICPASIEAKLDSKNHVQVIETRQILLNQPRIRFAEKGHVVGEDVYGAFGQTFAGRYLVVFFVYKPEAKTAIVISAREMTKTERRRYGRK